MTVTALPSPVFAPDDPDTRVTPRRASDATGVAPDRSLPASGPRVVEHGLNLDLRPFYMRDEFRRLLVGAVVGGGVTAVAIAAGQPEVWVFSGVVAAGLVLAAAVVAVDYLTAERDGWPHGVSRGDVPE